MVFFWHYFATQSNDNMIDQWLVGKDLEGSSRDRIEILSRNLPKWTEEN
jgi:hypothetical protein